MQNFHSRNSSIPVFTGWEDPPLALDGVEDAKRAGRVLKQHGFQFDVMYTSWLARAIQTGMYVLDELDSPWIPVIKSWRLNERNCRYHLRILLLVALSADLNPFHFLLSSFRWCSNREK